MYHGDINKSSENYFYEFVENHMEQLFYIIWPFIEDRVKELLFDCNINIETSLNGKNNDLSGLREDIKDIIYNSLKSNKK